MTTITDLKPVYTTGELATLLHVDPATVARAIDRGDIKGYRIPGSRHRRVEGAVVAELLRGLQVQGK